MLKKISNKTGFLVLTVVLIILAFFVRIYKLDSLPPSLYWEEAALGYDAYSILQTGKDFHGHAWPIVAFESFGDWKPSLYFYVLVPFIKVFGLNEWAVRLPAAISGGLTAIGCSYLIYLLFEKNLGKRTAQKLALLALFFAGLNPWLIQFSRGGWEISLATALITGGVVSWFLGLRKINQKKAGYHFFLLSGLLLGLSMYAQHSARLIAPLLGFYLLFWSSWSLFFKNKAKKLFPNVALVALTALIIVAPLIKAMFSTQVQQRFTETSIFTDMSVIERSNYYRELNQNSFLSRIFYHRYLLFGQEILQNFLAHFNFSYLFLSGDANPRHSTEFFGLFYHFDLVLMLFGLYYLASKRKDLLWLVVGWLAISILPASISTGAPHALRTLPGLPAWIILLTAGVVQLFIILGSFKKPTKLLKRLAFGIITIIYLSEFLWLSRFYLKVYPVIYAEHWQYGYKQLIEIVKDLRLKQPQLPIYITREQGRPAMYYWFYTQTDSRLVQQVEITVKKDQGEFLEWQNITFIDRTDQIKADQFILAASPAFTSSLKNLTNLTSTEVEDLQGKTIWQIGLYQN